MNLNLKKLLFNSMLCVSLLSINNANVFAQKAAVGLDVQNLKPSLAFLKKELTRAKSNYVMVIAHRGNWHEAPENSILGIERAIAIGADMVEVDVRKTKDGKLVLMHDETVDRTTNGKGKVSDLTLAEIKALRLRMNSGELTDLEVPTFEEAMLYAKDKILVNVDKAEGKFKEVAAILKRSQTNDIALVKSYQDVEAFKPYYGDLSNSVLMTVASLTNTAYPLAKIEAYKRNYQVHIVELSFASDTHPMLSHTKQLLDSNLKLFYTPTSTRWTGGHHDARAIAGEKDASWGWLLAHGATILLSDYPKELIEYLKERGLRNFNE